LNVLSLLGSHAPVLHLRSDTVTAGDHVRVLGVTFSSDLSLEKHVSKTCSASFHWLRQLRRVRKSLDDGSAATLVHAFVTSRVAPLPPPPFPKFLDALLPRYLADQFTPASDLASRLRLRSANRHQLTVRRCRLNTYGRRAFSVAGPTVWNSLPRELRDPTCGFDSFKKFLKTILLVSTNVTSALEVFLNDMRYINSRFTYFLSYLLTSTLRCIVGLN